MPVSAFAKWYLAKLRAKPYLVNVGSGLVLMSTGDVLAQRVEVGGAQGESEKPKDRRRPRPTSTSDDESSSSETEETQQPSSASALATATASIGTTLTMRLTISSPRLNSGTNSGPPKWRHGHSFILRFT